MLHCTCALTALVRAFALHCSLQCGCCSMFDKHLLLSAALRKVWDRQAGESYAAGPMLYDGHTSTYFSNTCRHNQARPSSTRQPPVSVP